jgi:hypothetical protein
MADPAILLDLVEPLGDLLTLPLLSCLDRMCLHRMSMEYLSASWEKRSASWWQPPPGPPAAWDIRRRMDTLSSRLLLYVPRVGFGFPKMYLKN